MRRSFLAATGLLAGVAACRPHAPAIVDAGAPRPLAIKAAPARAVAPPRLPPAPEIVEAPDDGCHPYWEEVDLACDEAEIRKRFHTPAGPIDACDPTHERLMRSVLSIVRGRPAVASDPTVREYLRGVAWNDDPDGLLSGSDPLAWCRAFLAAQGRALHGHVPGPASALLDRSQFGDLQFLHGLAARPGETAQATYDGIISWLELTYCVGTGEIPGTTPIAKAQVPRIAAMFPRQSHWTVARLLQVGPDGDVKARAIGSFLHLLQDLVGSAHTWTRPARGHTPVILHDFTYAGTRNPGHADIGWRAVWTPGAPLDRFRLAKDEIERGVDIVTMASRRTPWATVRKYLDHFFFEFETMREPAVRWPPEVGRSGFSRSSRRE